MAEKEVEEEEEKEEEKSVDGVEALAKRVRLPLRTDIKAINFRGVPESF